MHLPSRRSTTADSLDDVGFLANLTPAQRIELSPLMTGVDVDAGTVLTRQGAIGREFFIIRAGTAIATRDGEALAELGPGDHFGEAALLGDGPWRTATVVADSTMSLLVLTRRELASLLSQAPQASRLLLQRLASYTAGPVTKRSEP